MLNDSPSSCSEEVWGPAAYRAAVKPDVSNGVTSEREFLKRQKTEDIAALVNEVAHDFNNILYVITGNAELALDEIPDDTELHSLVRTILDAADRGKKVVSQILTRSRPTEQGKRPIDIAPVVQETVQFVETTVPDNIAMRFSSSEGLPPVLADSTQMHRLVRNLCTNAVHSMRECGGSLRVGVGRAELDANMAADVHPTLKSGSYLKITVSDTGCGMSPDLVERIFEPHFTTKRIGEGNGLGLAVVKRIVKSHGGAIKVETGAERGTTFRAFLPTCECASTLS